MRPAAGQVSVELVMLARLTRDLPAFLRRPITPDQAAATIRRRLETRSERFIQLARWSIYANRRSPYLRLLRAAGCELGDLRGLVAREGLEGALGLLARRGVYVSFDECKGRQPIVRGSERFAPLEEDFDNPRVAPHIQRRTGGTRGPGTLVNTSLAFITDAAANQTAALQAHGLVEAKHVLWQTAPIYELLLLARVGQPPWPGFTR
jgi:hypothetical protein